MGTTRSRENGQSNGTGQGNGINSPQNISEEPDLDEDGLEDLDELLDEFSSSQAQTAFDDTRQKQLPKPKQSTSPHASGTEENDFSQQLQQQMAALMGEADESPEMKKEIEALMEELSVAADPASKANSMNDIPGSASSPAELRDPFQETIRKTIERVQASGEQATAATEFGDEDNFLAQMLKELGGGDIGTVGGDEEFSKMLMNMMEQLTNKEILYDPMKELQEKFPVWMIKNRNHSDPDDISRFDIQQRLVGEIVGKFEETTYSDSNVRDREYIVERMQQMQAVGSPPADLVGEQEALGDLNSGCMQQ